MDDGQETTQSGAAESPRPTPERPGIYRQGDVLLVGVTALPETATPEPRNGRIVLALGEATGHAHAILDPEVETFRAWVDHREERFVLVRSRAQLTHEEHAAIALPAGAYRVVIQREYTEPQADGARWRTVLD